MYTTLGNGSTNFSQVLPHTASTSKSLPGRPLPIMLGKVWVRGNYQPHMAVLPKNHNLLERDI